MNYHLDQIANVFGNQATRKSRDPHNRKIGKSYAELKDKTFVNNNVHEKEVLRVCQALLLSTCVLLLSYHSIFHGRSEFSILQNGQIVQGYKHKAVVNLSLGYSAPYSSVCFLAIGMLAYSLVSKKPHWSLPSIVLYLADMVYDISGVVVAIWLFFTNLSLPTAVAYATASIILMRTFRFLDLLILKKGTNCKQDNFLKQIHIFRNDLSTD
nr:uncharacterized protein LOC117226062 isoform X1 [Megalopta genalis]